MGSEIGNGACKCYDQYDPQKRLIPKNVTPLAFKNLARTSRARGFDFFEVLLKFVAGGPLGAPLLNLSGGLARGPLPNKNIKNDSYTSEYAI